MHMYGMGNNKSRAKDNDNVDTILDRYREL